MLQKMFQNTAVMPDTVKCQHFNLRYLLCMNLLYKTKYFGEKDFKIIGSLFSSNHFAN